MKIIGTFGVVVTASLALLQPAQGGSRGNGRSFSPAQHYSAPAAHFSGARRNFSAGAARYSAPSARFSSGAGFRNRSYSSSGPRFTVNRTSALNPRIYSGPRSAVNRTTALSPRTSTADAGRFTAGRTANLRNQAFNPNSGRVVARYSGNWHRNWDRSRDHFWNGRRCHWHNNAWVIFDLGFYPYGYGYGYYPYGGAYPYYDNGYYDDSYASNEYSQNYDSNADSSVSQVQSALAREGYYRGAIDGNFGQGTRSALRRYQRDHGLDVTGQINRPVIEALGLR
jgi:hypothetical protein